MFFATLFYQLFLTDLINKDRVPTVSPACSPQSQQSTVGRMNELYNLLKELCAYDASNTFDKC
jgi:hypothetical protein